MVQVLRGPCDTLETVHFDNEACEAHKRPFVLAATILGSSMAFVDGSALTVALPALRRDFDADLSSVQWVFNAYILSLAAFTLIGGALADKIGRRRIFVFGIIVFAAASLACALAPSLMALNMARFAQGIGAALLTPASLALLSSTYPGHERGRAIGTWAATSAITAAGGPILGGWLTETFGWQAIFYMNLPLALMAILLALKYAPPADSEGDLRKIDWMAAVLVAVGLAGLAFGLVMLGEGRETGTPLATSLTVLSGGILTLLAFIALEARSANPMMPLGLFRSLSFAGLNAATLAIYTGLSAMFFVLPFDLIERRGLGPTEAGVMLLPFTVSIGLLSRRFGGLADRTGAAPLIIVGSLVAGAGFLILGVSPETWGIYGSILPGMTVLGLGFALLVAPLTTAIMASVDEALEGTASGINNTASRVAQLLGTASGAALATALTQPFGPVMVACAALTVVGALIVLLTQRGQTSPAV